MGLIQQIKQFISPTGEVAQNELPAPIGDVWTRHNFTPIVNWAGAYHMWKANPVAQACSLTYSLMMPEAQLGVVTPTGYNYNEPIVQMLTRNQWRVTMGEIMTILCIGGNAYGYKLRNASGAVIGIRWYSDKSFAPVNDGYGDVSHYLYYDGQVAYEVRKEDVVHIVGFWYDPEKPLGGGSPVELAAQSIEGYNEASATVFNIHKNDAMPKTIVVYDEELTPEQVSLAERSFKRKYGGDRRGSVGIMWGVKDVKRLALDWNELGLADTFGQYETRICGAYKVHPIIAGTHMGLSQSTYSNFEQASKDFTNMVRVPFWNMLADQLNAQLAIPEYGVELGFDLSTVQALAGDHIANEAVSTTGTTTTTPTSDGGAVPAKALDFRYKIGSGEEAVIVDIDETLITGTGNPKQNVIDYVNAKHETYKIHIVTGRMTDDRERTLRDLERIGVKYDELHLNDTTAPTITWKEYKAGKILEEQPVDLAIDNDRDTRAMYRSLGIDTLNPADIPATAALTTKEWLQHPDGYVYSKQYDDVLKPYDERIAKSWAKTAMKLAEYMRDTKNRSAIETKADDFSIDIWTQEFLDATEKDRSDLIDLVVRLSQEEVDAPPSEFAKAREAGQVESSNKIVETVPTLRADVQSVILANPRASADELSNLIYDKISNITKSRANAIGRTTATATTGTVQKSVWDEIGGIKRTWVALAGARAAHAAAHDQPEEADGMFVVGGERTPYPAGPGLTPANSVNCRCFARARRDV